ncbi:hypothetical protein EOPP23_11760 [Endozoicomonas sp. OPT23]|uniref:protein-tyrosine phosphatase family protein n=1 Tax=Endozoicomonas sp. OPT23 TaxID=2072845 RepID=UPI00129BD4C9|nr:protein-tyrosine phosphatase family protein [Endozoicomonas sp. OPT23]MRI33661.1 hypothetical protein [Endozoicomonas sp. OPT23]
MKIELPIITKIEGGFSSDLNIIYDTGIPKCPLRQLPFLHSQVKISGSVDLPEKPLNASHIKYDDTEAGIAMPATTAADTSSMLHIVTHEDAKVLIDLFDKQEKKDDPAAVWNELSDGKEHKVSDYTVQALATNQSSNSTITEFELTDQHGEQATFCRIHCNSWPDQGVLDPDSMDALHELIDQQVERHEGSEKLVINCQQGEGRTGVLFALRYLRTKAKRGELDINAINSEVFSVLVQGRMSRNADFVQSWKQILFIRDEATRYAKQFTPKPEN